MDAVVRPPQQYSTFDITKYSFPPRYVNTDRNATRRVVQHAEKRGIKALFITVDAPQLGRREKVMPPSYLH
jgi:isopentenyl diphosphate isomerase/L-lactate dehydrogenase-like FMN-dependent dehydrogenase